MSRLARIKERLHAEYRTRSLSDDDIEYLLSEVDRLQEDSKAMAALVCGLVSEMGEWGRREDGVPEEFDYFTRATKIIAAKLPTESA